jgi:hypothetical protein
MVGRDAAFIGQEIGQRLEDYSWAIRKHGIKTVLGTLSALLDGKCLLGAGGLVAGGALLGAPKTGGAAGLVVCLGKVAVEVGKGLIDVEDAKRGPGNEISYIYEVRKKFGA